MMWGFKCALADGPKGHSMCVKVQDQLCPRLEGRVERWLKRWLRRNRVPWPTVLGVGELHVCDMDDKTQTEKKSKSHRQQGCQQPTGNHTGSDCKLRGVRGAIESGSLW